MFRIKVSKFLLIQIVFYVNFYCCYSANKSFTPPELRSGGWTPIPTNNKNFKQLSDKHSSQLTSDSIQTIVSSKPKTQQIDQKQDTEMLPIPVIKPHRHGATLGFDLPDQGLTLYLDINELATKPLAQNIGLKVVSHDSHQAQSSTQPLNHAKPQPVLMTTVQHQNLASNKIYSTNESPLSQFVNKLQNNNNRPKPIPITVAKIQKRVKTPRNIGSYEGNAGPSPSSEVKHPQSPSKQVANKYHVGYMRPLDLQNALKQVGLTHHLGNQHKIQTHSQNQNPSTRTVIINTHALTNSNYNKLTNEQNEPKNVNKAPVVVDNQNPNPNKYFSTPLTYLPQISLNGNFLPQSNDNQKPVPISRPVSNTAPQPSSYSYSQFQTPIKPSIQYPVQEREPEAQVPQQPEPHVPQQQEPQTPVQQDDDFIDNEVAIVTTSTTPIPLLPPQQEDEQLKGFDDDFEVTTKAIEDSRFEEPQRQVGKESDDEDTNDRNVKQSSMSTSAHFGPEDDDTIVRPFPGPQQDTSHTTCPSVQQTCQQTCAPKTDNLIVDSSNIREVMQQLNADSLMNSFPALETELQNIMDFSSSSGYTVILPSNEAVSRIPLNLFEYWKNNVNSLAPLLDNHVLESAQSLEEMRIAEIIQPRSGGKLRVNRAHNDSYTINGERVVMANQVGPSGGTIHIIDGILYPNSDKDIMETLKSCNRLDGFVTLAEGTGFSDTLKQSGPFTVFAPSNEALQKVPDNDLDVIRNNMTALREFLKYHVAQGSYYSNDLRDGQFIPSMIDNEPIQVGVRVDGCRRRLVEANVSPLYRADIPASNGVIHVVDWILKPTDRDWCENIILPR